MYFGVPMLSMPIFGDQPYNARRAEYKGYGLVADILNFTPEELVSKIKILIEDPSYREKIQKASKIYRDRPEPAVKRLGWWIEHVLKYGGQHLRSYALDMPWYQYLMLDILCFILVSITSGLFILWLVCKVTYGRLCQRQKPEKLKKS